MTKEQFVESGEALFGSRWKTAMARKLDLGVVTVWRYANGHSEIPEVVRIAIEGLLEKKRAQQ